MENNQRQITFVRKRHPDYKVYASSVILFKTTLNGESILLEFAIDKPVEPSHSVHDVNVEGRINMVEEVNAIAVGDIEREFQAGVLISRNEARRLIQALESHLSRMSPDQG